MINGDVGGHRQAARMTSYSLKVIRDPATEGVSGVDVYRAGVVVGRWRHPHNDVWAESLRDKDDVRRLVREARGHPER